MAADMTKNDTREIYKLWYEFLLLSDRSKWVPFVTRDFGDIKEGKFDEWWQTHHELFEELEPFTLDVISNVDEYFWYTAPPTKRALEQITEFNEEKNDEEYEDDILVVAVNRLASRTDLIDAFTKLLKAENIGKPRGRAPYEKYNHTYSLFRHPDIDYLKTVLEIYKLKITTGLSNVEIENKLEINTRDGIWFKENQNLPYVRQYKNNQQNTVVKRHLEAARQIIENVALGEFPAYEKITFGENGNARNSLLPKVLHNDDH